MLKFFKHACISVIDVSSKFQTNFWWTLIKQVTPYQAATFHFPEGGRLTGVRLYLFLSIDYYKMLRKCFQPEYPTWSHNLPLRASSKIYFLSPSCWWFESSSNLTCGTLFIHRLIKEHITLKAPISMYKFTRLISLYFPKELVGSHFIDSHNHLSL